MKIKQKTLLAICAIILVAMIFIGGYYYYFYGDTLDRNIPACMSEKFNAAGQLDGIGVCNINIEDSDNCSSEDVTKFNTSISNMCIISDADVNVQSECSRETFRSNKGNNICEANLDLSTCSQREASGIQFIVQSSCGSVDNLQLPEDQSNNPNAASCASFEASRCDTNQIVNETAVGNTVAACCIDDPTAATASCANFEASRCQNGQIVDTSAVGNTATACCIDDPTAATASCASFDQSQCPTNHIVDISATGNTPTACCKLARTPPARGATLCQNFDCGLIGSLKATPPTTGDEDWNNCCEYTIHGASWGKQPEPRNAEGVCELSDLTLGSISYDSFGIPQGGAATGNPMYETYKQECVQDCGKILQTNPTGRTVECHDR